MRFIKTVGIAVFGIVIVVTGFIYDVLFAGIPYQDPTPALQAKYDFHSSMAGWLYKSGGFVFLLGLLAIPIVLKVTQERPGLPPAEK